MRFQRAALASLMAFVCILSACGGGSDSDNASNAAAVDNHARSRGNGSGTSGSGSTGSTTTSGSGGTTTPPAWWLANYCGEPGNSEFPSGQASYQKVMGKAPAGWLTYLAANYTPNDPSFGWAAASYYFATMGKQNSPTNNAIPIVALPMGYSASGNGPGGNLFAAIAAGTYDGALQGSVQAWAQGGYKTIYYRPGWEFNGGWYPWSIQNATDLKNYIAAFQHIYTVLHAAAATNGVTVNVVWNPNVGGNQAGGTSTWANWYPGNSYVDVIGIDNYGAPVDTGDPANAPGSATDYTPLQAIAFAEANGKPFSIPETGGNNSDGFITALGTVISQAKVTWSFIGLWNDDTGGGNIFSSSSSLGASFQQAFAP
ncbi:glycoside hydrolase family 26 protein [Caballeronia sp. LjRoot31]|uniref:glycoside hydrolase family 26 protein n=1 Tax=Caballeronia sp. LjRoot31 TaxID=3342324 RepID=UPI003ECCE5D5